MVRMLFIINPISGFGLGWEVPYRLKRIKAYRSIDYHVRFTEYAGHAKELARQALREGYDYIVAVGGDGTVNEVGGVLCGTDIIFGVISLGSGNGFARHLGFSLQVGKALKQLLNSKIAYIDMLEVNGYHSLNISGIGFDAEVAHLFSKLKLRGIFSYIYSVVRMWFSYPERHYRFRIGDKEWEEDAFIVSIANSAQYGYNASIAPNASLQDGLLDLCILKRPKYYQIPRFLRYFLNASLGKLNYYHDIQCESVVIEGDINRVHIDGDPHFMESPLKARVKPEKLRVVIPRLSRKDNNRV